MLSFLSSCNKLARFSSLHHGSIERGKFDFFFCQKVFELVKTEAIKWNFVEKNRNRRRRRRRRRVVTILFLRRWK